MAESRALERGGGALSFDLACVKAQQAHRAMHGRARVAFNRVTRMRPNRVADSDSQSVALQNGAGLADSVETLASAAQQHATGGILYAEFSGQPLERRGGLGSQSVRSFRGFCRSLQLFPTFAAFRPVFRDFRKNLRKGYRAVPAHQGEILLMPPGGTH